MLLPSHILLVDDDIDDQGFFCEALKETYPNCSCDIANTVTDALGRLKANGHYNYIFLDLNLPCTDGFRFLELIRADEEHYHIPIIILSTSSNPRDIERCKQLGAKSFYSKGNSYGMLSDMMKQVFS